MVTENKNPKQQKAELFVLKKEMTEKEFLRSTYLSLASDYRTPPDILSSSFSAPTIQYCHYAKVTAGVDVTCSASIGYNRQEKYKEYNEVKGRWEQKTRTVTDWSAYSGNYSDELSMFVENNDSPDEDIVNFHRSVETALNTAKSESIIPLDEVDFALEEYPHEIKDASRRLAERVITEEVINRCEDSLPGDEHKDFRASSSLEIKKITCGVAPQYNMEYELGGNTYSSSALALGDYYSLGTLPALDDSITEVGEKKTKTLSLLSMLASGVGLALSVAFGALFSWLAVACLLVSTGVFSYYIFKRNNIIKGIYNEHRAKKQEALKKLFINLDFEAPTKEELDAFEGYETEKKNRGKRSFIQNLPLYIYVISAAFSLVFGLGTAFILANIVWIGFIVIFAYIAYGLYVGYKNSKK